MRAAFIQLHIAVFLAGITAVIGKLITINETWLVWYRLLITVITLWILYGLQKKITTPSFNQLLKIVSVGTIVALHWVTFYGSVKAANVSIALVSFSLLGFFSSLTEPFILGKRIQPVEIMLGLLSVAGVAFIFHFDIRYKTGIILGVLSAFLAALFTVLNKKLLKNHTAQTVTLYELTGGFVSLSALLFIYHLWKPVTFVIPTLSDWGWLLILSWLCTVVAFYLSLKALNKISPFTINLTYNLEPVYGIILAFIFFKENKYLHSSFYMGLLLVLLAVMIQMWRVYKNRNIHSV